MLALGALTAGALPLYLLGRPSAVSTTRVLAGMPLVGSVGGYLPDAGEWAALYWLVGIPAVFALTALYYRVRGNRTGVEGRVLPAVAVGLVLLAVLFASSTAVATFLHLPLWMRYLHPMGDLATRGLSPLLPASLGLLLLSFLEGSRTRVAFAIGFIGVALLANLYDVENLLPAVLGVSVPEALAEVPNVSLPALVLLVGGLSFGLAERRGLSAPGQPA